MIIWKIESVLIYKSCNLDNRKDILKIIYSLSAYIDNKLLIGSRNFKIHSSFQQKVTLGQEKYNHVWQKEVH